MINFLLSKYANNTTILKTEDSIQNLTQLSGQQESDFAEYVHLKTNLCGCAFSQVNKMEVLLHGVVLPIQELMQNCWAENPYIDLDSLAYYGNSVDCTIPSTTFLDDQAPHSNRNSRNNRNRSNHSTSSTSIRAGKSGLPFNSQECQFPQFRQRNSHRNTAERNPEFQTRTHHRSQPIRTAVPPTNLPRTWALLRSIAPQGALGYTPGYT